MKDSKLKDYTNLDFIKKEVDDSKSYLKKIIGQLLMLQEDRWKKQHIDFENNRN